MFANRRAAFLALMVSIAISPCAAVLAQDNNAVLENVLLNDLAASTDADINALQAAFAAAPDEAAQEAVLEAASPILHGGEVEAVRSISRQTFGLINQRLAMLRQGAEDDLVRELEAWWQFYGSDGTQHTRGAIDGYDSTVYGLAGGVEKELFEDGFLGLSFSWGEAEAEAKGAGAAVSQADSYILSLYGDYDTGRTYANFMLSYGYSDIDTAKTSAAGPRTANFHASHYAARAEAGMSFLRGKTRIIPKLIAHYSNFSPDSYTEEGFAAQHITADSQQSFELGAGVDFNWLIGNAQASYFIPALRLGYRYDLAAEPVAAQAQFVAGGPVFEMRGADPAAHTFDLGMGITYFSEDDWELLFGYDLAKKQDYTEHAGMVRASYKFMNEVRRPVLK